MVLPLLKITQKSVYNKHCWTVCKPYFSTYQYF